MFLLSAAPVWSTLLARPSLCALEALRGPLGDATMTPPVRRAHPLTNEILRARRTGLSHTVGAPASPLRCGAPALILPLATLYPHPLLAQPSLSHTPMPRGVSYVEGVYLYIRNVIPNGRSLGSLTSDPIGAGLCALFTAP